jgi:hypothetical protein
MTVKLVVNVEPLAAGKYKAARLMRQRRKPPTSHFGRLRWRSQFEDDGKGFGGDGVGGRQKVCFWGIGFQSAGRPRKGGGLSKSERAQDSARVPCDRSTGIEVGRAGQAEAEEADKFYGGANRVGAAVEIAQVVEVFDGQGQAGNQPDQQQAVGVVVADVFQAVAILGIIEPLIFDLPTALDEAKQRAAAELARGKTSQPERLADRTIGFMLAVTKDPHGLPAKRVPRAKVVGVPDFHAVAFPETAGGRLSLKTFLRGWEQLGEVAFQAGHHAEV